jgi:surfeit locus 1 family protein
LLLTGFALVACLTCILLGTWQVRRRAEKAAWIAELTERMQHEPVPIADALADLDAFAYRRVFAEGELWLGETVLREHQTRGTQAGVHVITPLRLPDRDALLLVDRGFAPLDEAEAFLAEGQAREHVRIEGIVMPLERHELKTRPTKRLVRWNRLHLAALEQQTGTRLEDALLIRESEGSDTLPIGEIPSPRSRVNHLHYAITWYSIAAIAVVFALTSLFQRESDV